MSVENLWPSLEGSEFNLNVMETGVPTTDLFSPLDSLEPSIESSPERSQDPCLPFSAAIVNPTSQTLPDFDVTVEVANVKFSPDINEWVCYRRNHFSCTLFVHGNPGEAVYALIEASGDAQAALFQTGASRKGEQPVDAQLLSGPQLVFHRLHFKTATKHNNLVAGRINPHQQYFHLVVTITQGSNILLRKVSERLVVRGGNPGRYKPAVPIVYLQGMVGINEEHPQHELVVRGDIQYTGSLMKQSDVNLKEDIRPVDPEEQLERVKKLRIYDYKYKAEYDPGERRERGVLAQEVAEVVPEAVGVAAVGGRDVLVVDRDRLHVETLGATQAVAARVDDLDDRLADVEAQPRTFVSVVNYYSTTIRTGCTMAHPGLNICCFFLVFAVATVFIFSLSQNNADYFPDPPTTTTFLLPLDDFLAQCQADPSGGNGNGGFRNCLSLYEAYVAQWTAIRADQPAEPTYLQHHFIHFLRLAAGLTLGATLVGWALFAFLLAIRSRVSPVNVEED